MKVKGSGLWGNRRGRQYVKSPVASLCLVCSSVRKRVRVMMSVLIFSWPTGPPSPLVVPFVEGILLRGNGVFMMAMESCIVEKVGRI